MIKTVWHCFTYWSYSWKIILGQLANVLEEKNSWPLYNSLYQSDKYIPRRNHIHSYYNPRVIKNISKQDKNTQTPWEKILINTGAKKCITSLQEENE